MVEKKKTNRGSHILNNAQLTKKVKELEKLIDEKNNCNCKEEVVENKSKVVDLISENTKEVPVNGNTTLNVLISEEVPEGCVGVVCPSNSLVSRGQTLNAPIVNPGIKNIKVSISNTDIYFHGIKKGQKVGDLVIIKL